MKTRQDFELLVSQISYKCGWHFHVKQDGRGVYLQISVDSTADIAIDPFTGTVVPWSGAKHYMSEHMCDSEVVGTVFDAIRRAEEHEMREWFRFKKRSIFNPHMSVHVLHGIAGKLANLDLRKNAMSMEEST
jgi:hypothetical protein